MKNPHNKGFALCQPCWGGENGLKLIATNTLGKASKYPTIEKQFQDGMAKKKNTKGLLLKYSRFMTKLDFVNMRNISRILPKGTMVKQMRSDGGMDPILDVIYGRPK